MASPDTGSDQRASALLATRRGDAGKLYLWLAIGALVLAALSLLIPSTPSYDPWAWIVWGREIVHLDLHTVGGPSWKPLPVIFTTLFAPFGSAAPDMWLVVARAGALVSVALCFKLAGRLTRSVSGWFALPPSGGGSERSGLARRTAQAAPLLAGSIAALGLISGPGFITDNALGYSEGLMAAVIMIAVDRHLDGERRQAFAVSFVAALDRPEIWPFWGLYGLYLGWKEPGARRLVGALFVITPLLWFLPELWGSGHLFRGVNRAQHPRSNSPAFTTCPFCTELKDHAWKLLLLRVKIAAAVTMLAAGFRIWQRRRAHAEDGDARLWRGDGAVLAVGALGLVWFVTIAVMTQVGFSGNNRYLVLGSALVNVVGGVGWGWAAFELGGLARRFTGRAIAPAVVLAALIAVFAFIPSWIGANVVDLPATHKALVYQARLRTDVTRIVRRVGGAQRLLGCGTVMTEGFQVPLVAWTLDVHTVLVQAPPASGPLRPPLPNVILQARANGSRHTALLPRLPRGAGYRLRLRTRTFKLYTKCK